MKKILPSVARRLVLTSFLIYVFGVLEVTLLSRVPRPLGTIRPNLIPFWSIYDEIYFTFSWRIQNWGYSGFMIMVRHLGGNLILLAPLGLYLPLFLKGINTPGKMALAGFLASLAIETTQLLTGRGQFNVDDLFLNTLGAWLGYLLFFRSSLFKAVIWLVK